MNLRQYDPDFDPKTYKSMPGKGGVFDRALFPDAETHKQAETQATEEIRTHLSNLAGGKPVYSKAEVICGRGRTGQEIFDKVSKGEAVV